MVALLVNVFFGLAGVLLVLATVNDVFQSVIVPRAVGKRFRISFLVFRGSWYLWPKMAWALHGPKAEEREDFLALYAPFTLVLLLLVWTACAILGYGLLAWVFRDGFVPPLHSFGEALYFAGTSLTTIGFGDITPVSLQARYAAVAEGIMGQFYLAILVARLVGMQMSGSANPRGGNQAQSSDIEGLPK